MVKWLCVGVSHRGFGAGHRGFGAGHRGFGAGHRGLGASHRGFGAGTETTENPDLSGCLPRSTIP